MERLKIDREQETRAVEQKNAALLLSLQNQKAQLQGETEELRLANGSLRNQLAAGPVGETEKESGLGLNLEDPNRFVEAARSLNVRQLQWINYQLGLMLNRGYPPQYYQYPMQQMYGSQYAPAVEYKAAGED